VDSYWTSRALPAASKQRSTWSSAIGSCRSPLRLEIRRAGRLQVSLRNRNGDAIAARCYLTDSDGFSRAPIGALERLTLITGEPYFYADGGFSVALPAGPATLEVVQGLETSPLKRIIPIVAGETSYLELEVEPGSGGMVLG